MATLERDVERKFVKLCAKHGLTQVKVQRLGVNSWPDRLVLLPDGRCCWVELKRPGETATPRQQLVHEQLQALGHPVLVADDAATACAWCIKQIR